MQRMPLRTERPQHPQSSRSFSRYEPSAPSTLVPPIETIKLDNEKAKPHSPVKTLSPESIEEKSHNDIFDTHDDDQPGKEAEAEATGSFPEGFDDLPIEIQSLMERCVILLALSSCR